jgi:hypothetical protein
MQEMRLYEKAQGRAKLIIEVCFRWLYPYPCPSKKAPQMGGQVCEDGWGSVAPTPLGLESSVIRTIVPVALDIAAAALTHTASTVPTLTVSALKAALV